uniref:Uncharacterized protein n=1 Tax=Dunaliella tertiolecta TaxID=3047 RepID=A0A7S3R983_DUNTE|mmetsp:Transcript_28130/g.75957  ORF Transcript_28130/g.75957 Transcript_28130/m.75957 type:complete len:131 (+) Transcript_28130:1235-1627(+)
MSKKNSLAQKRKRHEYDMRCEKEAAEKKQKASLKKAEKKIDKPLKKKTKSIRIRRGVKLRGIKVKDADSKKKVRKLLAQEQAMKMAIDEEPQMSSKKSKGISVKAATKRATKKDKVAKKTDSDAEGMVIG